MTTLTPTRNAVRERPALWHGDILAMLPWFLIPYDSLTHLAGADLGATSQTLPATAVFSIVYLLLRGVRLRQSAATEAVLKPMLLATLVMAVLTVANMGIEYSVNVRADWMLRLPVAVRQGLSMVLGLATLLMFQDSLLRTGLARCMRWTLLGALPSLALAAAQLALGADRVQGFSSEPSHLADMLVFAFLPACAVAAVAGRYRIVAAATGTLVLIATFSTTGFLKAFLALLAYFAGRGQLIIGTVIAVTLMVLCYLVLSLFPDNYVFLILSFMQVVYEQTGELVTGSFIDRFFGLIGPLSVLDSPHAWLGFGFGGDTVYFDRLFSADTADAIRDVKGDVVSISSLQGKVLMYGGVVGYGLYLAAFWRAMRACPSPHLGRVMLPTVLLSSLFSLGPIFLPYIWLWLAIASTVAEPSPLRQP